MSFWGFVGLLGIAATALVFFRALGDRLGKDGALAASMTLCAGLAWLSALALTPGRLVNAQALGIFWGGTALATAFFLGGMRREKRPLKLQLPLLTLALLALPALTLLVGLFAAPNTYDALAYHLPRAVYWIQEGGLWPFATHDPRQLFFAPLAEVLQMQMLLLAGSDRLVALPQWASYAASGILLWGAARRLGGERAGWLAMLAFWSAPMAIAQASSAQNDLICAAFCLAALTLLWRASENGDALAGTLAGLAAGLACLCKPTAYIFLAPWILALAWKARAVLWKFALAFALLQAPYWAFNLSCRVPLLGPNGGTAAEGHSPALVAASVLKDAALHIPELGELRPKAAAKIDGMLRALGQDPVDKRSTSYWNDAHFGLPHPKTGDDSSGANWAQAGLWILLMAMLWRLPRAAAFSLGLATLGALLFCALVKWQPWATRLHTPGFALASLGIGLGLASLGSRLQLLAALLMLGAALPALLHQEARPLLSSHSVLFTPRWDQYFRGGEGMRAKVEEALLKAQAAPCAKIALTGGGDHPEYLLWEGLRRQGRPFELRSVQVSNASVRFEKKEFSPCLTLGGRWKME